MKKILSIIFTCVFSFINSLPSLANTLAGGKAHSLVVDEIGHVWVIGDNEFGQLGLGHNQPTSSLVPVLDLPLIKAVAASENHSIFLDRNGKVWVTGYNRFGQLGLGHSSDINSPSRIDNLPKIQAIATGAFHSIFLDQEGKVWVTGLNGSGELGLGHSSDINSPSRINNLPKIQAIAAGFSHSIFLDVNGKVWALGKNQYGQLGFGNYENISSPVKVPGLPLIKAVAAGVYHSTFLDKNQKVWITGVIRHWRLDLLRWEERGSVHKLDLPPIIAIAAGGLSSIYLDNIGQVWNGHRRRIDWFPTPKLVTLYSKCEKQNEALFVKIGAGDRHSIGMDYKGAIMTWESANGTCEYLSKGVLTVSKDTQSEGTEVAPEVPAPFPDVQKDIVPTKDIVPALKPSNPIIFNSIFRYLRFFAPLLSWSINFGPERF